MESQFSVDYGSSTANQEPRENFASAGRRVSPPYWQFVNDFKQNMGEDAEPDALFFVESWMFGAAAALENLKQRRSVESKPSACNFASQPTVPNPFAAEPLEPESFNASEYYTEPFAAESFIEERQRQIQFCTSHYALPQAPIHIAARPHRTMHERVEPIADDFDCAEYLNQPMTRQRALQVLGVPSTSTRAQIKSAYRRMVNAWHPDRFAWRTDRAHEAATEKMSIINKAYMLLRTSL